MTLPPAGIRIAVVGTGAIAQVAHLPILSRMPGVTLTGLFDADRQKALTLAERLDVPRVFDSVEAVWEDDDVQAVIIATPSNLHGEQVRAALSAGKFVFCEKPLALTAEEARSVLATPGADGRLMVGMNQRFRPDASTLRHEVAAGRIGSVGYLRAGWLNRRAGPIRRTWRHRRARAGGGALMDLGIQLLDLCLWLVDYPQPRRLVAHMLREQGSEVEHTAMVVLELQGGVVVNLEVTWDLVSDRDRLYLNVQASSGSGSLPPLRVLRETDSGVVDVTPDAPPERENLFTVSYRNELTRFAEAVRGEATLPAPREQEVLLRLIEAAYTSAERGEEVRF
ncbi:MAG TPA: Gfo/Idh/MocA family oxidoreductase [Longimicrobiaceae bacterium]